MALGVKLLDNSVFFCDSKIFLSLIQDGPTSILRFYGPREIFCNDLYYNFRLNINSIEYFRVRIMLAKLE